MYEVPDTEQETTSVLLDLLTSMDVVEILLTTT